MMKFQTQFFLVFALVDTLVACRNDPLFETMDLVNKTADIVLATKSDILSGRVEENSYVVGFKAPNKRQIFFHKFYDEAKFFNTYISNNFLRNPSIKDISFLSSIDLSDPRLFDLDTAGSNMFRHLPLPKSLELVFKNNLSEPKIALISRVDFRNFEEANSILRNWEKQGKIWSAEPNYRNSFGEWDKKQQLTEFQKIEWDWKQQMTEYQNMQQKEGGVDGKLYWHERINLPQAFGALAEKSGSADDRPIIAVMDSGVDIEHPALKNQIWENPSPGAAGCGNDDLYGCNTTEPTKTSLGNGDIKPYGTSGFNSPCAATDGDKSSSKNCHHGTHVSGIIAGRPSGGWGGVCPICKIMVLRIVGKGEGKESTILDSSIIGALQYITNFTKEGSSEGAVRVVNASFGKFDRSRWVGVLIRSLKNTPRGSGALVVAAAGNEDTNKYQYPAAFPDVIAVSNLQVDNAKYIRSNYGRWVDIAAPGDNIYSAVPGRSEPYPASGTSMAAPVVAGVAGLVLAANVSIGFDELRNTIITTADASRLYGNDVNKNYLVMVPGSRSPIPLLGSGLVDALAAVNGKASEGRYAVESINRVSESCGTINTKSNNQLVGAILIFAFPLGIGLLFLFFSYLLRNRRSNT